MPDYVVVGAGSRRVVGVAALSVVDASIVPTMVRANTHLTAVMIGEHVAARRRGATAQLVPTD